MTHVLVVDDEPAIRTSVRRALRLDGYAVEAAEDGEAALELAAERAFDAVVLDIAMPGIDGLEVCRRLRATGDSTAILMLTARDAVSARVAGLDAGADDYLVKPFALAELKARLRALMRRAEADEPTATLRFADILLEAGSRSVARGGEPLQLSRTEFALLELFMTNPRQVLSRTQIYEAVWGYDFGHSSNSLGVYIGYLRRKTEAGGAPRVIHTVHGVGYVLREE